jgi:hypothetical protein
LASPWTSELKEKVTRLWEKHSDSVIASILRAEDGVSFSRNAIIGLRHRLGAVGGPPASEKTVAPRPARPPRTQNGGPVAQKINRLREQVPFRKPPNRKPVFETVPTSELRVIELVARAPNITIIDLEPGECRWPTSEEAGKHFFCGHPAATAKDASGNTITHSYCVHHRGLSLGPGTVSERAAHRGVGAAA